MPETELATTTDAPEDRTLVAPAEVTAWWGATARNPTRIKAILALLDAGRTQTEVAKMFALHPCTINRIQNDWSPVVELAERRAKRLAIDAVESLNRSMKVAEEAGKHGPQVALLTAAGLMRSENSSPIINIVAGAILPGL
jgi:hypothetical protein